MSVEVTTEPEASEADADGRDRRPTEVSADIRRRLTPVRSGDWWSWAAAAWVVAIAAILRLVKLPFPPTLVFDEVYYAVEAQELLDHGVEWKYHTDSAGVTTASNVDFVVHPPLGKWIIALGIQLFGNDSFGWRIMPVVFGVASVLIVTRLGRRMFRSTVLGAMAGLLVALDGMHFVLSRTAILDVFVMFFIVAAFACLVIDRDQRRARWLRELENGLDPSVPGPRGRPRFGWAAVPWWRLGAAVLLGLGCGVKWSVIFVVPVFVALIYFWEVGLRKTVGARHPWRDALLDEMGWVFAMGALMLASYLATWSAWFAGDNGWKRHFLRDSGQDEPFLLGPLYNLWAYHVEIYNASDDLSNPHNYQSSPWQWLLLGRPVAFYWNTEPLCGEERCAAEILLLGTPVLWWAFIPALIAMVWFAISRRDWRPVALGAMAAASIVPWFYYDIAHDRTMYYFYALPSQPFLVLGVVYVFGCLINGPGVGRYGNGRVRLGLALPAEDRRLYGTIAAGAFVVLVAISFWIYYPIYVGDSIPYEDWWRRMILGDRWV